MSSSDSSTPAACSTAPRSSGLLLTRRSGTETRRDGRPAQPAEPMITRREKEAAEEATQKAFCDEETCRAGARRARPGGVPREWGGVTGA